MDLGAQPFDSKVKDSTKIIPIMKIEAQRHCDLPKMWKLETVRIRIYNNQKEYQSLKRLPNRTNVVLLKWRLTWFSSLIIVDIDYKQYILGHLFFHQFAPEGSHNIMGTSFFLTLVGQHVGWTLTIFCFFHMINPFSFLIMIIFFFFLFGVLCYVLHRSNTHHEPL